MVKKIYVYGAEYIGWSIDEDVNFVKTTVEGLGYRTSNNFFCGEVFCVNWVKLHQKLGKLMPIIKYFSRITVWITNDLDHHLADFEKFSACVSHFICANSKQQETLKKIGISEKHITILPYWTDPNVFNSTAVGHKQTLSKIVRRSKDELLIGTFQRDSLGSELDLPKWQKNPTQLVELMKLADNKIPLRLVLAGPRRHYIIGELKRNEFPYHFEGDKTAFDNGIDDIKMNTLNPRQIAGLYNTLDAYVVTSVSEGGPKAIMECLNSNCLVFSRAVGVAPDLLTEDFLFNDSIELINKLINIESHREKFCELSAAFRRKHTRNYYTEKIKKVLDCEN